MEPAFLNVKCVNKCAEDPQLVLRESGSKDLLGQVIIALKETTHIIFADTRVKASFRNIPDHSAEILCHIFKHHSEEKYVTSWFEIGSSGFDIFNQIEAVVYLSIIIEIKKFVLSLEPQCGSDFI